MRSTSSSRIRRVAKGSAAGITAAAAMALPIAIAQPAGALRWYGRAEWFPAAPNNGAKAQMNVTAGAQAADIPDGNFVSQVLWEATANTVNAYWVEVGWTNGWNRNDETVFYWADNRPNGGNYNKHKIGTATPDPSHPHVFEVFEDSAADTWDVLIDGNQYGTSTHNPHGSQGMAAGEETPNLQSEMHITGAAGLEYKTGSTWNNGWFAALHADAPAFSGWVTPGYYEYDGINTP